MRFENLVRQKFGYLLVKNYAGKDKFGHIAWECKCKCGNMTNVLGTNLKNKYTQSCGCLQRFRVTHHGNARDGHITREYTSWYSMKNRCCNKKFKDWKNYGGRGIHICKRWKNSFVNFLKDMGKRPKGLTLDRINNNGNYTPSNCRWATWKQQAINKRKMRIL